MKALQTLPAGYEQIFEVDLQKNKKVAIWINAAAAIVAVIMAIIAAIFVPISSLFDMSQGIIHYFIRFGVLLGGMIVYIILHELVHGVTMKIFGAKKIKYGFTGLYAFAGCDDYFDKKSYIVIALAPVVLWGIVLAVANFLVPLQWFWVVYVIQMSNVSGAAGDVYVTAKFSRMPKDILVHDTGVGMTVFSLTGAIENKNED
jgi:hypothetical protein